MSCSVLLAADMLNPASISAASHSNRDTTESPARVRLTLAAIGKLKAGPDRELFDRYWGRLEASGRAVGLTHVTCVELPESRAADVLQRQADETARLLKAVGPAIVVIAIDEAGSFLTSAGFAKHLGDLRTDGRGGVALLVGGPDGHHSSIRERATLILNLGTLTLPHGLARIILAEQLYRATTILSGHPYHRA